MRNEQVNVRVQAEPLDDRPLIRQVAAKLRNDPDFRARLGALLGDNASASSDLVDRVSKLEQAVSDLRRARQPNVFTDAASAAPTDAGKSA